MINYIANGIGISAVIVYLLSYQQKSRKGIMAFGMVCRALYLVQYVMLLAYEGAILEILSMITLFFAQKRAIRWFKNGSRLLSSVRQSY